MAAMINRIWRKQNRYHVVWGKNLRNTIACAYIDFKYTENERHIGIPAGVKVHCTDLIFY